MRFEPNDDQATFFSFVEQMATSSAAEWKVASDWSRYDWSETLDQELEKNGFYDCALEDSLGPAAAAAMIYRLGILPVTVECAASSLLRPLLGTQLPRPIAVLDASATAPIRFLPKARTLLDITARKVRYARIEGGDVEQVESLFAYPMGVLAGERSDWAELEADPEAIRNCWRIAVAAEVTGALQGGLNAVLEHVRNRYQFGRPLGSFQAIQHRLAACGTKIEGSYWLTLKAAQSRVPSEAAMALGYIQTVSTEIIYDLHQFMGAMGLTLEHPLHRWTYRARLLRSTFGGASQNLGLLARLQWRAT